MATPSEILRKTKAEKTDKDDKKGGDKSPKSNALIDFIAKCKK